MVTKKYILSCLQIICLTISASILKPVSRCPTTEQLASAANQIIENFYLPRFSTVNVIDATDKGPSGSDFINSILTTQKTDISVRLDSYKKMQNVKNRKKRNSVIVLEKLDNFPAFNEVLNPNIFQFRGYYVFVVIRGKVEKLRDIFELLWKKNIFNVAVIYQGDEIVEVATFLPFSDGICDNTQPKVINTYQEDKFANSVESIFPEKFENLQNCSLVIAAYDEPPAIIRKSGKELSGFDVEMVNEISKRLNFFPKFEFSEGAEAWGSVLDNGTSFGALGKLHTGQAQLAVSRFFLLPSRLKFADSSNPYFTLPVVFVISPGRRKTNIEKLLQPFDAYVWILLLVTLSISVIVILIISWRYKNHKSFIYGSGVEHPMLNLFAVLIGDSLRKLPGRNFARFILMTFVIFCLVIRSAYQSSLFNFLQTDEHVRAPETIYKLVDMKYELYMNPNIFELSPRVMSRYLHFLIKFSDSESSGKLIKLHLFKGNIL